MARLADTLAEAEAELPADILRYLEAYTFVDTLHILLFSFLHPLVSFFFLHETLLQNELKMAVGSLL